jgi:uncharacterized membrane protein YjjP (DUF1212 family)
MDPHGTDAQKVAFCLELGKALHAFGTPAHRFEEAMHRVAQSLGLEGNFLAHPTAFFAELKTPAGREVFMVRAEPGGTNLSKLVRIQAAVRAVADGSLPIEDAAAEVRRIAGEKPRFGAAITLAAFALSSGLAARFFGGGWREMALASAVGLAVGLLEHVTARKASLAQVFVLLAASLAGFAGVVLGHLTPHTAAFTVTLAAIVILLPGLKLTIALREVATGNLVAGSSRLTEAAMILLMLAFGVAMGRQLAFQFAHAFREATSLPLPAWTEWLALAVAPATYLVFFQGRRQDLKWMFLGCLVSFLAARAGAALVGPELGAGIGAMATGIAANLFGRRTRLPNQIMLLPGLLLLVPGSVGFRGLAFLTMGETEVGVQTAFRMVFLAVALVMGLSLANAVAPPRKGL